MLVEYLVPNSKLLPNSTELYSLSLDTSFILSCFKYSSLFSNSSTSLFIPILFSSSYKTISSPKFVIAWNSSDTLPPIVPLSLTVGIILMPSRLKIFIYTSCILLYTSCISSSLLANE